MKNTVKTLFCKTLFIIGVFCNLNNASAQSNERIKFIFGTRTHPNADGSGCEGEKGICILIIYGSNARTSDMGVAELSEENGRLKFDILEDPDPAGDGENTFFVYEDKTLPSEAAERMGYSKVVIRRGEYPIDKNQARHGSVLLKAEFFN